MKLAPQLYRLGNDIIAAYLIDTVDGILLIDAGLPGHWKDLERTLSEIGKSFRDIRGLILTHGDSDHIGFAERLRTAHDVPVFVHSGDADRAQGRGKHPKNPIGAVRFAAVVGFFAYALRKNGIRTRHLGSVVEVADGDVLDLPGSPIVVGTPGHSPGSVVVHVPVVRAVFVGDALTTRNVLTGVSGVQPAPFTDDVVQAEASLDALAAVDADWVLPGHGAPWQGSPASIVAALRAG